MRALAPLTPAAVARDGGVAALPRLALKINAATAAANTSARSAVEHALVAGVALLEAKSYVPHGEWDGWLRSNCTIAVRTAQAYMRLAKSMPALSASEAQRVADLPLRQAISAISTTERPEGSSTKRWEVVSHDEAGRIAKAMQQGAAALRKAARDLPFAKSMPGRDVEALKKRLRKILETLEAAPTMTSGPSAQSVAESN